jgi:glutamate-1-semialdehyde aminotransferase
MATFDHRPGQPPIASGIFTANWHEADEGATFDPLNALGDRVHESLARAMRNNGYPGPITGLGSMINIQPRPAGRGQSRTLHPRSR